MSNSPISTRGLRVWTDWFELFPGCSNLSFIQKCPHCGGAFMTGEAKGRNPEPGESYTPGVFTGRLSFPELKKAFLELEARVENDTSGIKFPFSLSLIQGFNDAFREVDDECFADVEDGTFTRVRTAADRQIHRSTIDRLLATLLPETDENKVFIAEMLRETGRFKECLDLLDEIKDTQSVKLHYAPKHIETIRQRALVLDDKVAEFDISDEKIMVVAP